MMSDMTRIVWDSGSYLVDSRTPVIDKTVERFPKRFRHLFKPYDLPKEDADLVRRHRYSLTDETCALRSTTLKYWHFIDDLPRLAETLDEILFTGYRLTEMLKMELHQSQRLLYAVTNISIHCAPKIVLVFFYSLNFLIY